MSDRLLHSARVRKVACRNYRCLRDVGVTLTSLTLVVGPEGAGKTALVEALDPCSEIEPGDIWRRREELSSIVSLRLSDGSHVGYFSGDLRSEEVEAHAPRRPEFDMQRLDFDLDAMRRRAAGLGPEATEAGDGAGAANVDAEPERAERLTRDGSNFVELFAGLDEGARLSVSNSVCMQLPVFQSIELAEDDAQSPRLVFSDAWDDELVYEADEVPAAAFVLVAMHLLARQRPRPDLLVLESPELALSRRLRGALFDLLRELAHGERDDGAPLQIVVTSRSLECFYDVEPREACYLSREDEDGASICRRPTARTTSAWHRQIERLRSALTDDWFATDFGAS
jgi:predicted ATPase